MGINNIKIFIKIKTNIISYITSQFRSLRPIMLRGACGIVFMVDSVDRKMLHDARAELHHAIEYLDDMNGQKQHHILSA